MSFEVATELQVTGETISVADLSQLIQLPDGITGLPHDITILEQTNNVDDDGNTVQTFVLVTQQPISDLVDGNESQIVYQLPLPTDNQSGVQISVLPPEGADISHSEGGTVLQAVGDGTVVADGVSVAPEPPVEIRPPVGKGPFTCESCEKVCEKWGQYQRHVKSHANDKPHVCPECKASFNMPENLALHKAIHVSGDQEPVCPDCGKKFSRVASLKAHIMMHERDETLMCPECGDEFGLQSQLSRHMKEHQQEVEVPRTYTCRQCTQEFSNLASLRQHSQQHRKIKTSLQHRSYKRNIDRSGFHNQCTHCGKTFQKPSQLQRHSRIHTGERPYVCLECNKAFNQKGALQIHMTKHTGSRPFVCDFCSAMFAQRGNLRAHIKRVHSIEKSGEAGFSCHECSCVFRKIGSLHSHISRVHTVPRYTQGDDVVEDLIRFTNNSGEVVVRPINPTAAKDPADATQTTQPPPAPVSSGGDTTAVDSGLLQRVLHDTGIIPSKGAPPSIGSMVLRHDGTGVMRKHVVRRINGIRWHQCNWCSKEFKKPSDLVRHMRIHTHEKPYKCTQCFRSFTVKSTLTAHIKTHTGVKEFSCTVCHKMFATQGSLKVHVRLHTGHRPFECPQCHKSFRTSTHLKTHIDSNHARASQGSRPHSKISHRRIEKALAATTHLPEVTLQEPILITDSGLIQQQIRQNTVQGLVPDDESLAERPYKCGFCQRGFKKSSHLKQHVRSHTGERPYKCITCQHSFVSNAVLKAHIRTHTGVKAYKCLICDILFTTNGSLKRHMTTHSEVRPFMCPYCQKTFKTSVNCKKHMKTHKQELALQVLQQQQQNGSATIIEPQTTEVVTAPHPAATDLTDVTNDLAASMSQSYLPHNDLSQPVIFSEAYVNNNFEQLQQTLNQQSIAQIPQYTQSLLTHQTLNQLGITQSTLNLPMSLDLASLGTAYQPEKSNTTTLEQQLKEQIYTTSMPDDRTVISEPPPLDDLDLDKEAPDSTRVYSCSMCERSFKKSSHLKQHMLSHTREKPYKCTLCNGSFVSGSVLKTHIKTHNRPKNHRCHICDTAFTTNGSLTRHLVIHKDVGPLFCTQEGCAEVFNTHAELRDHARVHKENDDRQLLVTSTDRAPSIIKVQVTDELSHIQSLSVSEKVLVESAAEKNKIVPEKHSVVPVANLVKSAHQCEECSKSFKKPSDLLRHIRTHTGEKPFVCIICARQFTVKSTLDSHMKTHSASERNFQCHICSSLFSTRGSLKVHMRLHTGAKPFTCPHCQLRFRTSGHRKSHILSHFKSDVARRRVKQSVSKPDIEEAANQQMNQIVVQPMASQDATPGMVTLGGDMLRVQPGLQMSLTGDMVASDQQQVISSLEGLQLQFTGNLGQGIQIANLDPGMIQQPVQIDGALLQQLQQRGNINIAINPNLVQPGGSNLVQIQPISLVDNQNILVQPVSTIPVDASQPIGMQIVQPQIATRVDLHQQVLQPQVVSMTTGYDNLTQMHDLEAHSFNVSMEQIQPTSQASIEAAPTQTTRVMGEDVGAAALVPDAGGQDDDDEGGAAMLGQLTRDVNMDGVLLNQTQQNVCYICFRSFTTSDELNDHMSVHVAAKLSDLETQPGDGGNDGGNDGDAPDDGDVDSLQLDASGSDGKAGVERKSVVGSDRKARNPSHKCAICNKLFQKPSQLERHVRIHTGERPFVCTICDKAFNQKNALNIHKKKHSGERPFMCPYCFIGFTQKGNLNVHIKRAHHHDMVKSMAIDANPGVHPAKTPQQKRRVTSNPSNIDVNSPNIAMDSPNIGINDPNIRLPNIGMNSPNIGVSLVEATGEHMDAHMMGGSIDGQPNIGSNITAHELGLDMNELFGNT